MANLEMIEDLNKNKNSQYVSLFAYDLCIPPLQSSTHKPEFLFLGNISIDSDLSSSPSDAESTSDSTFSSIWLSDPKEICETCILDYASYPNRTHLDSFNSSNSLNTFSNEKDLKNAKIAEMEKETEKDVLTDSHACSSPNVSGDLGDECSNIQSLPEKSSAPKTSISQGKIDKAAESESKKRCIFPARRTKVKPLPILEDDQYPAAKRPVHSRNGPHKYNQIGPSTSKKFLSKDQALVKLMKKEQDELNVSSDHLGYIDVDEDLSVEYNGQESNELTKMHTLIQPRAANQTSFHDIGRVGTAEGNDVLYLNGNINITCDNITLMDFPLSSKSLIWYPPKTNRCYKEEKFGSMINYGTCSESEIYSPFFSSSPIDFERKHILDLLVLINMSGDFLGCLKDTFSNFVNKAMSFEDKNALFNFLNDRSNLSLIEACQDILDTLAASEDDLEDIHLSVNALKKLLKCLKTFEISNDFLNIQKLAFATTRLNTTEIHVFLKMFLKFRNMDQVSPEYFCDLYQRVLDCQMRMANTKDNLTTTSQSCSLSIPPEPAFSGNVAPIWEKASFSGRLHLPERSSSTCSPKVSAFKEENDSWKTVPTLYHKDDDRSCSNLPFFLEKKDLEKLVTNFAYLQDDYQQAVRDYIKVLATNKSQYAASLLQRIEGENIT